jgi:hypothetical protein
MFLKKQGATKLIWQEYHFCLYRQEISFCGKRKNAERQKERIGDGLRGGE